MSGNVKGKHRAACLPRTFKDVARVLQEVRTSRKSLKYAVYSSKYRGTVLRKIYGMVTSILKNMPAINFIRKEIEFKFDRLSVSQEMVEVLINEVIKKHPLPGKSPPVMAMEKYRKRIEKAYTKFKSQNVQKGTSSSDYVPKYARIQTIITSVDSAIKFLLCDGFVQKPVTSSISLERYHEEINKLKAGEFIQDKDFRDVLVFSRNENLVKLHLFKSGGIFLQDKASYLPVHALNPEPGGIVLDCCAAPGMKTAHLACMMKNTGHVFAIDKDVTRIKVLKKTLKHGSVKNCTYLCEDFTNIDPNQEPYSSVQYILVDPSCSGSGMIERIDSIDNNTYSSSSSRIAKLARFQIMLLKHALSFPHVKKVVYSTCSIHEEENEYVIEEVLNTHSDTFRVVCTLPDWPTRGSEIYKNGKLCVRASPKENLTKGFFVAVLERISPLTHHQSSADVSCD